mgnify:CR=1 FL=1
MIVNFNDVAFSYGDNLIFEGVNFSVNEGEKIALIGANGEGKTTLIKLMTGSLSPEKGEVITKNGAAIGWLEQNGGLESLSTVYEEMMSVFSRELAAVEKLSALSDDISRCQPNSREYGVLSAKLESLQKFVAAHDAYNVDVKVKRVLNGMGFAAFYDRVISTMSGGEKTRLKLAKLLLEQPDLLILDEPTNHLDVETMYWLEDYLSEFKGAVFVVSHDRYFLDRIASRTLELENKSLSSYPGNYSKYKILKAERNALALKEYEKQREEIAKLKEYIDKNIVRATTAKSAQSRVKQLEKMELLSPPYIPPAPPRFTFSYTRPPYERVLTVKNLKLEAGGKTLVADASFEVLRGQKIAVVGKNGAGKSTLLKRLVSGEEKEVEEGRYVRFAVYDQENLNLDPNNTVLAELWDRHVAYNQTEVRASLARCGLVPEDMDKKVKSLSGGERAKLALCVFENEQGNVLVMDEPTNHLDLPARESLENALKNFDGTVIFVSHDRYFISAIAQRVFEISDGRINIFEGDYESFMQSRAERQPEPEQPKKVAEGERQASYRSKKERAEEVARKQNIKRLESAISQAESEEEQLNARLALPEISSDYKKAAEVLEKIAQIRQKIDGLYEEYALLIG